MARVLGICPLCMKENLMFAPPGKNIANGVRCIYCGSEWAGWPELFRFLEEEELEGHPQSRVIPVAVWNENGIAELTVPERRDMPFADAVLTVFGAAVLVTFTRLCPHKTDMGGLVGRVGKWPVVFQNQPETVGIRYVGSRNPHSVQAGLRVLKFYEKLLRRTFEEPMRERGRIVRPGELLWLDQRNPEDEIAVWEHLKAVLFSLGSGYPEAVEYELQRLSQEDRRFLRGLNEGEMAELFLAEDGTE